ncbi:MAG: hypothetical protein COS94_03710 [Candidatus Hydrogenedentes bacterium CG07_land_8_20_14_0_80_42_17]|nr:MAG: hypothetical protein COS94_03710 [Candidatus Hydrogenedentes bacterium CG07_land_8_20_14_0_80_42_17]
MKILVATSDYPPALGGMAVYSDAWCRELAGLGAKIRVVARDIGHRPEGKSPIIAAKYFEWKAGLLNDPINAYKILRAEIKDFKPDIVMAHTWIGWGPALAILKSRCGVRYVLSAHGAEIIGPKNSPWYRFLMKQSFKAADKIFPVSNFTAQHIKELGISSERIEVITNGVDLNRYYSSKKNQTLIERFGLSNCKVLVTVGGLVDRKGHDVVISALAILKKQYPDLKYLIAGGWALNSSRENYLRELVAKKNLSDQVIFSGFISDELLPDIYRLGDVFIMTGREMPDKGWVEGFGISYLEAAACGIPIIATLSGGTNEAVTNQNALIVPPDDPVATADAISILLSDEKKMKKMSESGIEWARQNSWSSKIKMSYEILKEI